MKLAKAYEPNQYEETIYALWESSGAFKPSENRTGERYSIVMPPPNANGNLHIGHALVTGLQDIMTRYHRMKGDGTVYIPGADHAGFETWVVYEKLLEKEGKSRMDFSREKLYSDVWEFVEKQRGGMEIQLRELGASCDWDHLVFTLDSEVIRTAYETFKQLWDDDLVYRSERLVNYCTKHKTAFADIEVNYEDRTTPLYYIKYGPFTLATTRPETKFGDTGVAVHPGDERYKQYVGKEIEIEGVEGSFKVRVVADEHVDPAFGTGAVKVTPAHDFNDWDIAQRHGLHVKKVIDEEGRMMDVAGRFADMTVTEARVAVAKALEEKGLLERVDETYTNRVGTCYKCGTVIEPMLRSQWFVKMQPLAQKAIEAIEREDVRFTPESKSAELTQYLRELRDWNISRQIPWGIPIPAFQSTENADDWIFNTDVEQKHIDVEGTTYNRDEDTFDTWFSSGQWPYIVTQYAHDGALRDFYPTSLMETGADLLRPWVARMLIFGLYRTGEVPFRQVYMHGMVLDEHGKKMSKSKGNVINPQEVIREYGSDALRMGLVASRSAGQSQAFSTSKVVAGRNFCNKLWNIARYVEGRIGEPYEPLAHGAPIPEAIADHWIVKQIDQATDEVALLLESHRFAEAADRVYHTIWDEVADWYIESSKEVLNEDMLAWVLLASLRLAHPFAPFVTETIWQTLGWKSGMLINEHWPAREQYDQAKADTFESVRTIVNETRYVVSELGNAKHTLVYEDDQAIEANASLIRALSGLKDVKKVVSPKGLRLAIAEHAAWLDVGEEELYEHQTKLELRLVGVRGRLEKLSARLANESYTTSAPAHLVEATRNELSQQKALAERLSNELDVLRS